MSTQPKTYLTPEEYLAFERKAEYKNEYLAGEVFAMTGASREHNLITINLGGEVTRQLRGRPCEAYASEMRVRILAQDEYRVEQYVKQTDGRRLLSDHRSPEDVVELASVQCALALREVYEKVTPPPGD